MIRAVTALSKLTTTLATIALVLSLHLPIEYPLLTADVRTQQETVKSVLLAYFGADSPLVAVAYCESSFRQYKDGTVLRSKTDDLGALQVNVSHETEAKERGEDLDTLVGNMMYSEYLYETQGLQPWGASRACWQPLLDSNLAIR